MKVRLLSGRLVQINLESCSYWTGAHDELGDETQKKKHRYQCL